MAKSKPVALEHINYSFVPNHRETMQALAMANFTSYEFRVIVALMNQTNGYLREEDEISSTFWQALTLMPRQRVHEALHRLIEKGVIAKHDSYYRVRPPNEWPPQAFDQPRACKRATSIAHDLAQREREPHRYQWLRNILKPSPIGDDFEEKPSARTDASGAAGGENPPLERTVRPLERTVRPLERTVRPLERTILSARTDDLATPKERESSKESSKESPKESGAKNSFSPSSSPTKTSTEILERLTFCFEIGWGRVPADNLYTVIPRKPSAKETAQLRDLAIEISSAGDCPLDYIDQAFGDAAGRPGKMHVSYVRAILLDWLGVARGPP